MKSLKLLAAMLCVPFVFAATLSAADDEKKAEAPAETKKPSLTYYFFDG